LPKTFRHCRFDSLKDSLLFFILIAFLMFCAQLKKLYKTATGENERMRVTNEYKYGSAMLESRKTLNNI